MPDAWVVAVKKRRRTGDERASERASEQSYGSADDGAPSWSGLSVLHEVLRRTRARSLTEHDPDQVETYGS